MHYSWAALVGALAVSKASWAERQGLTLDDLQGIGHVAALHAQQSWRADGGRSMSSWVYLHVNGAMNRAICKMAQVIGEDDASVDPQDCSYEDEVETAVLVREALSYLQAHLPQTDWALLWLHYAEGYTAKDLARQSRCNCGAMRVRVTRAKQRAVTLLRDADMV